MTRTTARRIILAAVDALTDAELVRLAREIRRGQTAPLTGRERVEHCGPDSEQMLLSIIDPSHSPLADSYRVAEIEHPAGCACLPCRKKVM